MADNKHDRPGDSDVNTPDKPGTHHIADEPVADADALGGTQRSPTTETRLPIEEQVRKEWDPKKDGGLPTELRNGER